MAKTDVAESQAAEVLSASGQVLVPLPRKKKARRKRGRAEDREGRIEEVERELYERNLGVVLDASYFGDLSDEAIASATIPEPWIKALGVEEAWRRFRVAKAAALCPKKAPTGLGVAKYIVGAFAKAKADAKRPVMLNVALIRMPEGPRQLPSIEIVEGEK